MASLQKKKKGLNKAGFFRLERKQQKMDKMCLQEARREAIEVNCALFIFIQVQGHIKLSSQEVPNRRRGIASCRCVIKSQKSSGQGVMNSKTLHYFQEKWDDIKKDKRFPQN